MQKKSMILSIIIMGIGTTVLARQPIPADMRGAADMRSQMERQVQGAALAASSVTGRDFTANAFPASTPEKEMERRRKLINDAHSDFLSIKADMRAPVGSSQTADIRPEGTGADARAQVGNEPVSASSNSLRNIPEPPRAVAVEGRIVIEGGQADARAPRDQGAGIRYSIEERFVGNLIIATLEPEHEVDIGTAVAKGRLAPDEKASASGKSKESAELSGAGSRDAGGVLSRDYQIDTVSTGVKVISLGGGACIRSNGERDAGCVDKDPFTKSKVSEEDKYGNFNDGVVAAQREGNNIKIEVSAPDVSFSTATDKGTASVGCSNAIFEVKASEFKQMMDSGSMTMTKQVGETDGATSGCRQGSSITLHMTVRGK